MHERTTSPTGLYSGPQHVGTLIFLPSIAHPYVTSRPESTIAQKDVIALLHSLPVSLSAYLVR